MNENSYLFSIFESIPLIFSTHLTFLLILFIRLKLELGLNCLRIRCIMTGVRKGTLITCDVPLKEYLLFLDKQNSISSKSFIIEVVDSNHLNSHMILMPMKRQTKLKKKQELVGYTSRMYPLSGQTEKQSTATKTIRLINRSINEAESYNRRLDEENMWKQIEEDEMKKKNKFMKLKKEVKRKTKSFRTSPKHRRSKKNEDVYSKSDKDLLKLLSKRANIKVEDTNLSNNDDWSHDEFWKNHPDKYVRHMTELRDKLSSKRK
ncbi:hypothetical protein SNEBB_001345 [Seison nebaliae]|nr:hypothetical protein SNEBB_001345 [Seison nebaliae]